MNQDKVKYHQEKYSDKILQAIRGGGRPVTPESYVGLLGALLLGAAQTYLIHRGGHYTIEEVQELANVTSGAMEIWREARRPGDAIPPGEGEAVDEDTEVEGPETFIRRMVDDERRIRIWTPEDPGSEQ
jgi:hypothetical protein